MIYLDTSAIVKLVVSEAHSDAMRGYYFDRQRVGITSAITRTELPRAISRSDPAQLVRANDLLRSINWVVLNETVLDAAGSLPPESLRTLDAIHLVTALAARSEIDAFVSYDMRVLEAAQALGLPTDRPV